MFKKRVVQVDKLLRASSVNSLKRAATVSKLINEMKNFVRCRSELSDRIRILKNASMEVA